MGFRLLLLASEDVGPPDGSHPGEDWPARLREAVPDIQLDVCRSVEEAMGVIPEADAAFGDIVPELFDRAEKLKWIACPFAGPPAGYYHQALVESDVVVTNVRGIYNDHISAHIMSMVLAFARGLHHYVPQQHDSIWRGGHATVYLPEATAVIVGVGGIGGETARLCAEFGMEVIGVDARLQEEPPSVSELHPPDALNDVLPRGDFVIVTVPETPETQGMFGAQQFRSMKPSAYLITIGRGATVLLDDLVEALRAARSWGPDSTFSRWNRSPPITRCGPLPVRLSRLTWRRWGLTWMSGAQRSSSITASGSMRVGRLKMSWTRPTGSRTSSVGEIHCRRERPRWDSNPRAWLRRPELYPLSYGGGGHKYIRRGFLEQVSAPAPSWPRNAPSPRRERPLGPLPGFDCYLWRLGA